jgi:hypothetical protein
MYGASAYAGSGILVLVVLLVVISIRHEARDSSVTTAHTARRNVFPGDLLSPPVHDDRFRKFLSSNNFKDFRGRDLEVPESMPYHFLALRTIMKEVLPDTSPQDCFSVTYGGFDYATSDVLSLGTGVDFDVQYTTKKEGRLWKVGGVLSPFDCLAVLEERRVPVEFEVLKLDFDGWECDVIEALLGRGYRPKIIIVELNPAFVPPMKFSLRYLPTMKYLEGNPLFYGCSLQYAYELLKLHGYGLLQYAALDGYFIRSDLLRPTVLAPMAEIGVREHYMAGNGFFWGTFRGELLASRGINFLREWFYSTDPIAVQEAIRKNITHLHSRLVSSCAFSLSIGYVV